MTDLNIETLSTEEKLELLERLWDSLAPEDLPFTDAQREELDRRLDDLDRDGPVGIPWEDALRQLRMIPRSLTDNDLDEGWSVGGTGFAAVPGRPGRERGGADARLLGQRGVAQALALLTGQKLLDLFTGCSGAHPGS